MNDLYVNERLASIITDYCEELVGQKYYDYA